MNKNILKISTLVAFWAFCSQNATAQQGFGTNQPSKASVIEMKSGTKGLLIPRVALTGLNNFDPIKGELGTDAAKVNSLLVYNTATATGISPGYYYWTTDGTTPNSYWKRLLAGDDAAALNLLGDVTGTLGATTVVKIQGRDVANTAPTSNQVLTWNGTAWTPTSLTPAQITNKANLSVQDGIAITAGSGTDALLGAATIGITDGGIAPIKIQPAAEPRTTRMVMVTQTDGTVTWIPQTDIAPTTTNALSSAANSMTSNVNGVSRSTDIINSNGLSVTGTELTSTVNGVPATVDLASVVQAAQKTTTVTAGTNTAVTPAAPNATGNTEYVVNVATGNGTTLGVVRQADTAPSVTVTNGVLAVDPANVAITNALTSSGNQMSSTVNGGTAQTAPIINTNELSLNTDNELVSTINGVPSSALDLSAVVQDAETLTSITQDASTGVITYERERDLDQTANVVNATSDNLISYDAGAFLNATTLQGAQKTTVVESGDPNYATVSPNTPQGSNETTYTVTVKAAPRFFYMPAVVFNTDNQTTGTTTLTRDLYELYEKQFNGTAHNIVQGANTAGTAAVESVNYTGGVVSSANATNTLSSYLFTRGELEYHITYYDQTVFEIVGITEGGVLEYKIIGEATPMSYMNIVFVIK